MFKFFKQKNKGFTRTPKFGVTPKGGGFTLVETLVAISIFTISILGLMSVLASGVANTSYAKQKMVAGYLAQEGIEYVRNVRDTAVLYDDAQTWTTFKDSATSACSGAGCYINNGTPFSSCGLSCSVPLSYDNTTGIYGYTSGVNSGFIRVVKISQVNADELKVSSIVSWNQGSGNYNVTFSEDLFNWVE